MKKSIIIIATAVLLIAGYQKASAQAFSKGGTYVSLGLVGSDMWHFWPGNPGPGPGPGPGWGLYNGTRLGGGVNVQAEWGVHQYVGVGLVAGLHGGTDYWGTNYGYFSLPIGAVVNFHFWQLIDDKASSNMRSDVLDIYGGVSVGSGIAVYPSRSGPISPMFFIGPHAGIRWYFTPKVALNGELGYGKSFINLGFTFKVK